ncbi:MAG: hypothetical protein LBB41_03730 [Prevotellaceae bacterium]|jgi:hypothetical protein|nr:hypothetical protein [Prevotellaceae bacterium]
MKKTVLFLAAICVCINAFAQDVILLNNGQTIQAKVSEITEEAVKYKDFDFQEGPLRNLKIADIFKITYQNGKVEIFNKLATDKELLAPKDVKINISEPEFQQMNDKQVLRFLRENEGSVFYKKFALGSRQNGKGNSYLFLGILTSSVGELCAFNGLRNNNAGYYYLGLAGSIVGQALIITSIPLKIAGGAKKRSAREGFLNIYVRQKTATYTPELNFGLTAGGVGLTLSF